MDLRRELYLGARGSRDPVGAAVLVETLWFGTDPGAHVLERQLLRTELAAHERAFVAQRRLDRTMRQFRWCAVLCPLVVLAARALSHLMS